METRHQRRAEDIEKEKEKNEAVSETVSSFDLGFFKSRGYILVTSDI